MATNNGSKKKKGYALQKTLISFLLIICILLNGVYFIYSSFMSKINFVAPSNSAVTFTDYNVTFSDLNDTSSEEDDGIPDNIIINNDDVSLYLLVGSDSRIDAKDAIARSDSIIIAAIDRKHKKIKLISLMRDMLVKIAGTKGYNRINVAFQNDSKAKDLSLSRTRKTIEDTFGITLEKFAVVDFAGFKKLVDLMGGVEMEVSAAEAKYMCSDKKYGYFKRYKKGAGTYVMTGSEALNYARMRHTGNSDFDRTERQRKMIAAIIAKMKTQSYANLVVMINSALGYVTTNISEAEILGMAFDAPTMLSYSVAQYRIPVNGTFLFKTVILSGVKSSILWGNYKWNGEQLKKFIYDDDMTYAGKEYKKPKVTIPYLPNSVAVPTTTTTTAADVA